MSNSTLTFVLNDPPYESARSTTALRLIDLAVKRGINVNVFAYEGAAALAFAKQKPHGNPTNIFQAHVMFKGCCCFLK